MKNFISYIAILLILNCLNAQSLEKNNGIISCELCKTLFEKSNSTLTDATYKSAEIYKNYEVDTLSKGVFATDYAFFIDGSQSKIKLFHSSNIAALNLHFENILNEFYKHFPDNFDFALVTPGSIIIERDGFERTPFYYRVQNPIGGTGSENFDDSKLFGSNGRLLGIVYHSFGKPSILSHELGHQWSSFLDGLSETAHWKQMTNIGGIMSALPYAYEFSENNFQVITSKETFESSKYFSNLDLYLMGLQSLEEVAPIKILHDARYNGNLSLIRFERMEEINPRDIPLIYGMRIPSFVDSPKSFSLTYIVVKTNNFTQEEFNFHSHWSEHSGKRGAYGAANNKTFKVATYGKANLETKLINDISRYDYSRSIDSTFVITENYPNPFNSTTFVNFSLIKPQHVSIVVYNILGEKVATLFDAFRDKGTYRAYFDGNNYSSGVYFLKTETENFIGVKKIMMIK